MNTINTIQPEQININLYGRIFPVFKNPTDAEYFYIVDRFNAEYPFAPKGEPKTRQTYDKQGNQYMWMSGDSMHYLVERYLKELKGIECNQNKFFD